MNASFKNHLLKEIHASLPICEEGYQYKVGTLGTVGQRAAAGVLVLTGQHLHRFPCKNASPGAQSPRIGDGLAGLLTFITQLDV